MPELMFVLKSLAIAVVVTVGLQMRVGNTTLENQAHTWIQTSAVPNYLKDVSSGAIVAVRNATKISTDFIGKTFGHDSASQRAGRLNLEFKRSSQYQEEHSSKSDETK
jgi:hypothetical protein